ncbi:hypothetical protein FQA39_LY00205 [Lamprigera yunnana]|nr:hypothetical protein FQA39_LY00205 [Lamprigera yunnana]
MVEIIKALTWKYVSTVAVEGEYGEKGIASFISYSADAGICIATTEKVLRNSKTEDFDRIIEKLIQKPQARAVVLFVDEDNTRKLLQATIRANRTGHFLWIGSDSWGAKVHPVRDQEWAAEGAITILPHRNPIQAFDEYYTSLGPRLEGVSCNTTNGVNKPEDDTNKIINCRNSWFREFWSQHNNCTFDNSSKKCTGNEGISGYEQEGLVPFVVDAVYAAAHAIHNIIEDDCGSDPMHLCDEVKPAPLGPHVLKYLRNVSFIGRQGSEIRFNGDGDAFGSYNIYQYQRNHDGRYDYVQIGSWKEKLELNLTILQWRDFDTTPKSVCSDTCPNGHIKNYQDQCCWACVSCREDAFVNNDTCQSCSPGYGPNDSKTGCIKLEALVLEWLNPWVMVPVVFSSFGILCTLFTIAVFIRYNRTPVIMASGRELCYVLLTGVLCCYSMSFIILAKPSVETCAAMRVGLGLCLSVCYSAIFTKTNRISRIFNRGVKTIKRPVYTSPISQVVISLGIVSVQLVGAIAWLIIERPAIREIYPYPLTAVLTCRVSTFALIISLIYNMILIIMCTWYAFKTRKIPENFNEAKYIGFTMYSTCIVWLAFLPIYFGTNNDYTIQIVSMCMCLNISATVALGCLFTPKVYLVLFQPYKNVRQGNGCQIPGTDRNRPAYSMRFTAVKAHNIQSMTSNSKSSPRYGQKSSNDDTSNPPNPSIVESSDFRMVPKEDVML